MPTEPAPSQAITRFLGRQVYEVEATPRQLHQDVVALHAAQRRRAASRSRLLGICIGCFVATPVLLLAAGIGELIAFVPFALITLLAGIVLAVLRARRRPFDAARITTLEKLTGLLAADMAAEAPVRVRLDLRPPDHKAKFGRQGTAGVWQVRYFVDPWLQLAGRLLDGTTFQLRLVTHHQARSKTKRSASGKHKTKYKAKASHRARLRLCVKPDRYRGLGALVRRQPADVLSRRLAGEVLLPEPARVTRLDVGDEMLLLTADLGADTGKATPPLHHAGAMMFLGLYRALNFVRAGDRPQPLGGNP